MDPSQTEISDFLFCILWESKNCRRNQYSNFSIDVKMYVKHNLKVYQYINWIISVH